MASGLITTGPLDPNASVRHGVVATAGSVAWRTGFATAFHAGAALTGMLPKHDDGEPGVDAATPRVSGEALPGEVPPVYASGAARRSLCRARASPSPSCALLGSS
jgi:hypothetical protein